MSPQYQYDSGEDAFRAMQEAQTGSDPITDESVDPKLVNQTIAEVAAAREQVKLSPDEEAHVKTLMASLRGEEVGGFQIPLSS